jgi:hypothetical protein
MTASLPIDEIIENDIVFNLFNFICVSFLRSQSAKKKHKRR